MLVKRVFLEICKVIVSGKRFSFDYFAAFRNLSNNRMTLVEKETFEKLPSLEKL